MLESDTAPVSHELPPAQEPPLLYARPDRSLELSSKPDHKLVGPGIVGTHVNGTWTSDAFPPI